MTNLGDVNFVRGNIHGGLGPGLVNDAHVVDNIGLLHPDTGVNDGESFSMSVRYDFDEELLLGAQLAGVSEGLVPDLVQGICGVGDQLSVKDFLVEVQVILGNIGPESEGLEVIIFTHNRGFGNCSETKI